MKNARDAEIPVSDRLADSLVGMRISSRSWGCVRYYLPIRNLAVGHFPTASMSRKYRLELFEPALRCRELYDLRSRLKAELFACPCLVSLDSFGTQFETPRYLLDR